MNTENDQNKSTSTTPLSETTFGPSTKSLSKEKRDELILQVYNLAMAGKTNREISDQLLIKDSTLQLWKRKLRAAGHELPVRPGRRPIELPTIETPDNSLN